MSIHVRTLCVSTLVAATAAVSFVHGYVLDRCGLRWGGSRAAFISYLGDAGPQRAVAGAVRGWQAPLEGIVQFGVGGGSGEPAVGNGLNELAWEDLPPEIVSLTRIVSRSDHHRGGHCRRARWPRPRRVADGPDLDRGRLTPYRRGWR